MSIVNAAQIRYIPQTTTPANPQLVGSLGTGRVHHAPQYNLNRGRLMFKNLVAKILDSRKASMFIATAVMNILIRLCVSVGFDLTDEQRLVIYDGLQQLTYMVITYIAAQAGVDIAEKATAHKSKD